MKKAIAAAEEAGDEVEDSIREAAELGPELQAWYDEFEARETGQLKRMGEELSTPDKDGKVIIPSEEMERILEEVMNKDLDSEEVAQEYFDKVWEKMQVYKVRTDRVEKG